MMHQPVMMGQPGGYMMPYPQPMMMQPQYGGSAQGAAAQQAYYGAAQGYGSPILPPVMSLKQAEDAAAGSLPGAKPIKPKLSPYQKQQQKARKTRASQKQKDFDKGVRSFDSFGFEAGQYNEAAVEDEEYDS